MATGGAVDNKKHWLDYLQLWGIGASILGAALYVGSFSARDSEQERRIADLEVITKQLVPALAKTDANVQYLTDRERARDQRGQ